MSFTTIDANDPDRLSAFWGAVLGTEVEETSDAGRFVFLGRANGHVLGFQRVPETKSVKNRVHLDIVVADVERATALIEDLGGSKQGEPSDFHEGGWRWRLMADPEGNEFCLVPRAGEVSDAPTL